MTYHTARRKVPCARALTPQLHITSFAEASGTDMLMGCTWLDDGIALQKAPGL